MVPKEVTIYDLARELNMSPATISRGLNNSKNLNKTTVKKINEKAEEMGYRHNKFASNLRKRNSHSIGVLLHELNSNFITSVLSGIEKVSTEAGYDLIIAHSSESFEKEKANANNLFHNRVDGLIASLSFDTKGLEHFQPFFEKKIPVMFFDRVEEESDVPKVIIDNRKSGYQATKHLIEQGCKRIVLVTANLNRNVYQQRFNGYKDALDEAGLAFDEKLVMVKDLSEKCGRDAAHEIMAMKKRPDAAFITNDFSAAVCMQTLKEYGLKIPKDFAIVGFNNDVIGKLIDPQLTTINYPGSDMGEIATRHLISHLKGGNDITLTSTIIIKSELIIRKSSLFRQD